MTTWTKPMALCALMALAACGTKQKAESERTTTGTTRVTGAEMMDGGAMMQGHDIPVDTRVEDVEGGVRVTLTARDAKDVAALRERAHRHAEHMGAAGGCPMM